MIGPTIVRSPRCRNLNLFLCEWIPNVANFGHDPAWSCRAHRNCNLSLLARLNTRRIVLKPKAHRRKRFLRPRSKEE